MGQSKRLPGEGSLKTLFVRDPKESRFQTLDLDPAKARHTAEGDSIV